jgi:hypothetical protein
MKVEKARSVKGRFNAPLNSNLLTGLMPLMAFGPALSGE